MVRQFFSDTPTRAQATIPIARSAFQGCANNYVNADDSMAGNLWPPLFPDLLSPGRPDLQSTDKTSTEGHMTSNGEYVDNVDQMMSDQAIAVDGQAVEDLSSYRHESLPNNAPPSNDASSVHDSLSSAHDTSWPCNAFSNELSPSTASTPASTPSLACRVSFVLLQTDVSTKRSCLNGDT